jgi:hypothetical protein
MQCKDIPDLPILRFLLNQGGRWSTYGDGYSMPTVQDAMPPGTPRKMQKAKMEMLIRRGLAGGCVCGCRGDFTITEKGITLLNSLVGK